MRRLATVLVVIGVMLVAGGDLGGPPLPGQPGSSSAGGSTLMPAVQSSCEAPSLVYLIGKPKTQIPVPVDPSRRRVSCTTCPVTEDVRPERTDILFDQNTGLVTAVKCG
jgi:hypothetical protein